MLHKESHTNWKTLYRVGSAAALMIVVLTVIQIIVFVAWPPPSTVINHFMLLQQNWLLGLLHLDLLYIVDNTLLVLIYLALAAVLKRTSASSVVIALALGLVGIAAYFASNPAFEMLALSNHYAAALTDVQRSMLLAAGEAMLVTYTGTAFDVYYVLNAIALLIFAGVMLRSTIFSRVTAYVGLLAGGLMIVPSTVGTVGLYFALMSLVPWVIFSMLIARKLFQLGQGISKEAVNQALNLESA